ncbi:MAG: hypothetical protein WC130_04305 [Kiritimatiellia bacterium]
MTTSKRNAGKGTLGPLVRPVMAARRDASWFACPGVSYKYHVSTGRNMAACNPRMMPLDKYSLTHVDGVAVELRCQRNGCKQVWPNAALTGGEAVPSNGVVGGEVDR